MRDLTAEMAAELASIGMLPCLIARLGFDSGTLYMWNGYGTLTWQGNDYIGGGNLVGVSTNEETQDLEAKGIILTLSGIPSNLISLALTERSRGRPFKMWLGAIDSSTQSGSLAQENGDLITQESGDDIMLDGGAVIPNTLIGSPYQCFSGWMDVMEVSDDGNLAVIRLSVESAMLTGQRAKVSRYTAEDQKKRFSNDKGLDFINQLIDKEVVW